MQLWNPFGLGRGVSAHPQPLESVDEAYPKPHYLGNTWHPMMGRFSVPGNMLGGPVDARVIVDWRVNAPYYVQSGAGTREGYYLDMNLKEVH